MTLDEALEQCPIVAILRGVAPDDVVAVARALLDAGIRGVEVPLNSPDPLDSLSRLGRAMAGKMACGAGTVLSAESVQSAASAGAGFIVAPNIDTSVVEAALRLGLTPIPGIATPTEAFAALAAGAPILKLFPASTYGPGHLKALGTVLPPGTRVLVVGGVGPAEMPAWAACGAAGFGLGSELYRPGQSPDETFKRAQVAVTAARALADRPGSATG
ncbi:MAG TPA: 2-dehydro-3-deoxy-6-phosphogalactonate aldolase [Caulobacteraceae bacterium]